MLDHEFADVIEFRTCVGDGRMLTCLSVGIGVPKDAYAPMATSGWGGPRGAQFDAVFVDDMAAWGRPACLSLRSARLADKHTEG